MSCYKAVRLKIKADCSFSKSFHLYNKEWKKTSLDIGQSPGLALSKSREHRASTNKSSEDANDDCGWKSNTNTEERKRAQNRIAQRLYLKH
jgi:hypothetical protein